MALFQCGFYSEALGVQVSANVLLPQPISNVKGFPAWRGRRRNFPVLYLLHGLSDDHSAWLRQTSIERYAAEKGLAVVMPAADRSFYADAASGRRYFAHVAEEVPAFMQSYLPLSKKRSENFIAGLSMGGYGALKIAFHFPRRFAAAASLSGVVDVVSRMQENGDHNPGWRREFRHHFGDLARLRDGQHDLLRLSRGLLKRGGPKPAVYLACGRGDDLYRNNVRFKTHLEKIGYPFHYEEGPGGHEWGYWDAQIKKVIQWLPG